VPPLVEAPVPPSAIAKSVIPTMLPPVTLMLVIVPKLVRDEAVTPDANVLPVRPLANAALAVPVRVAVIVPALNTTILNDDLPTTRIVAWCYYLQPQTQT
jgi:hypothetical protein